MALHIGLLAPQHLNFGRKGKSNMEYPKGKKPIVQNLTVSLPVSHYIKMGEKSDKRTASGIRLPKKNDYFTVTTTERKTGNYNGKKEAGNFIKDTEIHKQIGEKPTVIPIKLIYNEIALNFPSRNACYFGNKLFCSGDGEFANQRQKDGSSKIVNCPCHRADPMFNGDNNNGKGVCKFHAQLFCLLDVKNYKIGGMARLSTTGYNAISGMVASMMYYQRITGGILAGIPFQLTMMTKHTTIARTGQTAKIYYAALMYRNEETVLQKEAYKLLQDNAMYQKRIEMVEQQALKAISLDESLEAESVDIVDEFHPEENIGEVSIPPDDKKEVKLPESDKSGEKLPDLKVDLEKAKKKASPKKKAAPKEKPEVAPVESVVEDIVKPVIDETPEPVVEQEPEKIESGIENILDGLDF